MVLEGCWQSPRFFADISARIRDEFRIQPELSPQTLAVAEAIAGAPASVSIHLRRLHGRSASGNRVNNLPSFLCDKEYYRRAFERIQALAGPLQGFVFADGPFQPGDLDLPCPLCVVYTTTDPTATTKICI